MMTRSAHRLLVVTAWTLALCAGADLPAAADVFRVDAASTAPAPDGATWATAFRDIQAAVNAASDGSEIWVAAGSYPFLCMKDGVSVYGGFAGTETTRGQRNWTTNVTIIDGQGARQCVRGADNATLDGFTVMGGKSDYGGGMYGGTAANCTFTGNRVLYYETGYFFYVGGNGGGMYGGTAVNCTFTGNSADHAGESLGGGGGMCGGTATNCTFTGNWTTREGGGMLGGTATNCTFTGNTATLGGGGMYSGTATNCTFTGNRASTGGGMHAWWTGTATNCTFTGNSAGEYGGGMAHGTATNCTFTENTANYGGGGMVSGTATNCILWADGPDKVAYNTAVSYSCVQGGYAGTGNIASDPLFVAAPDNLRLQDGSPCIDSGTLDGAPSTDLDGNPRPSGFGVDMGAFEYVRAPIRVTSPNGGEYCPPGTAQDIAWGTTVTVTGNVKLYLYSNWSRIQTLATVPAGDRSWTWNIPADTAPLPTYRIRVQSMTDTAISDCSDKTFGIGGPRSLTLIAPNGGESWPHGTQHAVTWSSANLPGNARVYLYDKWVKLRTLAIVPMTAGGYMWDIPVSEPLGATCRIRVQSLAYPTIQDYCDATFSIVP